MLNKKTALAICFVLTSLSCVKNSLAQNLDNPLGQTLQIYTRLHSFVGKPAWLLVIRDIDTNENIPYLFDIRKGNDFWLAITYGRNYLITASTLQVSVYNPRCNQYKKYKIHNFCHLESNGRIIHGQSMSITLKGDLSPYRHSYSCQVLRYADGNFPIANSSS